MRDMKSVITYLFQKKICSKKSNMKYERFSGDTEMEKVMEIHNVDDILEEEYLNCDLIPLSSDSSSGSSESLNESETELCGNGNNSCSVKDNIQENEEREIINTIAGEIDVETDVPVKLIVNYHFSFDTDGKEDNEYRRRKSLVEESETPTLKEGQKYEAIETSIEDIDDNDDFEDGSFCSEDEQDLLEYSSVKNGSKNNLLDDSDGPELCYSVKNVCLVNMKPDQISIDCVNDSSSETSSDKTDDNGDNIQDLEENGENLIQKRANQPTHLRKNYIYYSSAIKLYSGELRYEDNFPEKKFKFARKIFKKVFPSQKYVVNN